MKSILLLDDTQDNLTLMKAQLASSYHVLTANDTHEFLSKLESHQVDLAIVDYKMPTIDGKNFIDHIKMSFQYIDYSFPIIGITAFEDIDEQDWIDSGAQGCIKRPYNVNDLTTLIEKTIGEFQNT